VQELDPRLVSLTVTVNGIAKTYQDLAILARGMKYANPLQNECEVTIFNLDKATQDYILSETSPYNQNKTPKTVTLEAGRQSYGLAKIYLGNIVMSNPSQPPDIGITLKCLTGNYLKGQFTTRAQPGTATLSQVSKQIATEVGTSLNFQARDKQLANYSYTGPTLKQVDHLQTAGGVNVYIDNDTLVVKNANQRLSGVVRILNAGSGMVGIPEMTERGIRVKFLLDNTTVLGGGLQIQSTQYPAINGNYIIYKLGFEIANRDTPFYWIAEALRASNEQ
jgi:hypothetical protein